MTIDHAMCVPTTMCGPVQLRAAMSTWQVSHDVMLSDFKMFAFFLFTFGIGTAKVDAPKLIDLSASATWSAIRC